MARRSSNDLNHLREVYRVLVLHYLEGRTQAEIARETGQTPVKINRMIKEGRQLGMVQITVESPFQSTFEIEQKLRRLSDLSEIQIAPSISTDPGVISRSIGELAAQVLLDRIKDGDTICITGGKGMSALVDSLDPQRAYDVEVVPATGCVQGKHYTDVNHVATQLADKLGGRAWQVHAPLFADSPQQRDVLMGMRSVSEIMDKARRANMAIVGAGSIGVEDSSYYDLHPLSDNDKREIQRSGAVSELVAHLLDADGRTCDWKLNERIIGLTPDQLMKVPFRYCVAWGEGKVAPICSIVRGNRLNGLVTDETTATDVVKELNA